LLDWILKKSNGGKSNGSNTGADDAQLDKGFLPDPIDRTMLELLNAAIRTPSWANSHPGRFISHRGKLLTLSKRSIKENMKKA
jgi:hypothetical protein